jgi:hypothetical protein
MYLGLYESHSYQVYQGRQGTQSPSLARIDRGLGQTNASTHEAMVTAGNCFESDNLNECEEPREEHDEEWPLSPGGTHPLACSQAIPSFETDSEGDNNTPPRNKQMARPEQKNPSENNEDDTPQPSNIPRPRPRMVTRPHGQGLGSIGHSQQTRYNTRRTGHLSTRAPRSGNEEESGN